MKLHMLPAACWLACLLALPAGAQRYLAPATTSSYGGYGSAGAYLSSAPAASPGRSSAALVPAQFTDRVDSQGFRWDVNIYGTVQSGTDNCFSGAFTLMINGNQFRPQNQCMMTPDGSEYFLHGNVPGQNLDITRQVKVDPRTLGIRYIDQFRNPSPLPANFLAVIAVSTNGFQSLSSDGGVNSPTVLGKRESGVICFNPMNNGQISAALYLCGRESRLKPTIQDQNQSNLTITYNLTVPPGKTVAIAYGGAQCRLAAQPDAKAAAALLKPFASSSWLRGLAAEVRRCLVNVKVSDFDDDDFDDEGLADFASLDIVPGATDILALGPQTRLKGTAACAAFALQTRYGPIKASLDQVMAIAGIKRSARNCRVFFRDGQVLTGALQVEGLRFTTHAGLEIALSADRLDRLVMRAAAAESKTPKEVFALAQTIDGERLALVRGEKQQLAATTPWGRLQFGIDQLMRLSMMSEQLGHRVVLRDGTRLFGFLDPVTLRLNTLSFGPQQFSPYTMRDIHCVDQKEPSADAHDAPEVPHLVLSGENLLVGQLDVPAVKMITGGVTIRVPPGQIRHLRSTVEREGTARGSAAAGTPGILPAMPADPFGASSSPSYVPGPLLPPGVTSGGPRPLAAKPAEESPDDEGGEFETELWDGGSVTGRLADLVVPVRCGDAVWQIPVRDIVEAHVPTPVVPEATRIRIGQLIRDLGHPEYEKRKAAYAALSEMGPMAKQQLSETVRQTSDAEIRRSADALLNAINE